MKIDCVQTKLAEALRKTERVSGKNTTLPILSAVLLEVKGGQLFVRATNLELGVEISIPVKVEKEGVVAVSSQALSSYISSLQGKNVTLIAEEKIETTEAKAKAAARYVEKLITKAKKNDLATRRLIKSRLGSGGDSATVKLLEDLAPRYKDRNGGYTRVIKTGNRIGSDGAAMAIVELVESK
jgi:large subunit ribosomal protein L17